MPRAVLLVEDEIELARIVARELEAAGFDVCQAQDGETALRSLASQPPDIVVLDWMLPGIDGLEVLRRLRQTSALPVLSLTARAEETGRVIGLEVGADDYLTKPFGARELVARVRALLRPPENPKTGPKTAGTGPNSRARSVGRSRKELW